MDAAHTHAAPIIPPRLHQLRLQVPRVLVGHEPFTALEKLADAWLLSCTSRSDFLEECELVSSLLYVLLTLPSNTSLLLPQDLVFTFLEKWLEDGGRMEVPELIRSLKPGWRCGSTQTMLLLCANLMPGDWGRPVLGADFSKWSKEWIPNIAAPTWLLDTLGCDSDINEFVTMLRVSAALLQGENIPWVEPRNTYMGSLSVFLHAVHLYQKGDFNSSLEALQLVDYAACDRKLQAWVLWIAGLALAKLGKPHNALVKLQEAVDRSPDTLEALYNIAQVFHSQNQKKTELEVLDLLVKSGEDEDEAQNIDEASVQSAVLSLHHPRKRKFSSSALYLLACTYLQEKQHTDAAERLIVLVEKEADNSTPSSRCPDSSLRSLLRPEDTMDPLPGHNVLIILTALALTYITSHDDVLKILGHENKEEDDIGECSFYDDPPEEKMEFVMSATGQILRAEALKGLNHETEALREVTRLEQKLWWVQGVGKSDSGTSWNTVILQIKSFVYIIMSELHRRRSNQQNYHHYTRRAKQCLNILRSLFGDSTNWQDLAPSNRLAMNIIYDYFKSSLDNR